MMPDQETDFIAAIGTQLEAAVLPPAGVRKPGWLPLELQAQLSAAISLKRIADALEAVSHGKHDKHIAVRGS